MRASATEPTWPLAGWWRKARPWASSRRSASANPGTQLTLRTFHIGGIAGRIAEQTQKTVKYPGGRLSRGFAWSRGRSGRDIVISRKAEFLLLDEGDRVRSRFGVPYGAELHVKDGDLVQAAARHLSSGIRTRT